MASLAIGFLPPSLRSAVPQSSWVWLMPTSAARTAVCSKPAGSVVIFESIPTVIPPEPLRVVCAFVKCDAAETMKALALPSKKTQGCRPSTPTACTVRTGYPDARDDRQSSAPSTAPGSCECCYRRNDLQLFECGHQKRKDPRRQRYPRRRAGVPRDRRCRLLPVVPPICPDPVPPVPVGLLVPPEPALPTVPPAPVFPMMAVPPVPALAAVPPTPAEPRSPALGVEQAATMVAPTTVRAMAEMRGIILLYDQFDTRRRSARPRKEGASGTPRPSRAPKTWTTRSRCLGSRDRRRRSTR